MGGRQVRTQKNQKRLRKSIIGVGNSTAGKSELIKCYEQLLEKENEGSVCIPSSMLFYYIMVENTVKGKNNEEIKINTKIWDKHGNERLETYISPQVNNSNGIFLFFDITNRKTFDDLYKWIDRIKECRDISQHPIIINGNKVDLEDKRVVSTEEAKKFADDYGLPYFETSALTGKGVKEAFSTLIQKVYDST